MRLSLLSGVAFAASLAFASQAQADITIGLIAPLTGSVAAYGIQVKNGAETAVENINKNGGILGEKVVLKLVDDAADPKQGVSGANQLIGDGIKFVVGPVTSGSAMAVSDALADAGVVMVTPTATAPNLTNRGLENVFRTCGRDDQQAVVAAEYVVKNLAGKKVGVLHDKGPYGQGLADSFKGSLNKAGVEEVLYETLTPGEKDLSALVSKIKNSGVEVLYFGGYHPEAGLLSRQLADQGVKLLLIGGEGLSNTEYWAIAGDSGAGTLFTNAVDATQNPAATEAVDALKAKNITPEVFTLNGYAAVQVLKDGIEKVGNADDPAAVAKVLHDGLEAKTIIGNLTYDKNGDLTSPTFVVYKWEDGKIVGN